MGGAKVGFGLALTTAVVLLFAPIAGAAPRGDPLFDGYAERVYQSTLTATETHGLQYDDGAPIAVGDTGEGQLRVQCDGDQCTGLFAWDGETASHGFRLGYDVGAALDQTVASATPYVPLTRSGNTFSVDYDQPSPNFGPTCHRVVTLSVALTDAAAEGTFSEAMVCDPSDPSYPGSYSLAVDLTGDDISVPLDPTAASDPAAGATNPQAAADAGSGQTLALPEPPHHRGAISASVPTPADVSTDPGLIAANLVLAALMVLLVFPAELFNATLEENYDEVSGWFAAPRRWIDRFRSSSAERGPWVGFGIVVAVAALFYGFLDPNLAFDQASVAMIIGTGASIAAGVLMAAAVSRRHMAGHDDGGAVRVYPVALVVALVCVVVSRVADFQPGYLYGVVAGVTFTAALTKDEEGRLAARVAGVGLAVSLVAWLVWVPVSHVADDPHPNVVVLIVDTFLAAAFVGGLQSVVFGFLPLRFLPGAKVWAWSKPVWLTLFGVAAFGFLQVLLHPESGYDGSVGVMLALFVAFAAASVAFWAYFRRRAGVDTERLNAGA